jgi:hypothetical protein
MFTKKKILTFMLLLTVAAPLLFSSGFLINKEWIQYKVKEKLAQGFIETITTDAASVTWLQKDKEAIINGRLFDVKSTNVHGDTVTLSGLFDEEEDKLNKNLKDLLTQNNDPSSMEDDGEVEFFSFPINTHNTFFTVTPHWQYVAHLYGKFTEQLPASPSLPYLLPPRV